MTGSLLLYGTTDLLSKSMSSTDFIMPLPKPLHLSLVICHTKIVLTFVFNFPLYFLSNLRRTPGAFFTYYLCSFMSLLNGSAMYRSMGAMSRTLAGSQPPGAVVVMLLTIYSGLWFHFEICVRGLSGFLILTQCITLSRL